MKKLLWWGRSDPEYSRNRIVRKLLGDLGWKIDYFHPLSSWSGRLEAYLGRLSKPDIIWVPCFRQRDIGAASFWAKKWNVKLIADPLISAYQKEVYERQKWLPDSPKAEKMRRWEASVLGGADIVVADTWAHAAFFRQKLGVEEKKMAVLYVGAETGLFIPRPPSSKRCFEVLFFGSFLQLQGVDVIVDAAKRTSDLPITWTLLGDGDLKPSAVGQARGAENIIFEPWVAYEDLPQRLSRADILLGIFGKTPKAEMVIPNKMYQAMAVGRPVITRTSSAYPAELLASETIGWVQAGDPGSLEDVVRQWYSNRQDLENRGRETRKLFETYFDEPELRRMLSLVLKKAGA